MGLLRGALAVDEHVDVAPHHAALVEDPAVDGGVRALERLQQLADGRARELVVGAVAREPLEGLAEAETVGINRALMHREDVAGGIAEPRDVGPVAAHDPLLVLGRALVVLERDAALGERVNRRLDVVDREVEDGELGRRVLGLGVDDHVGRRPPGGG